MSKLINGTRVAYAGDQKQLQGLKGVVKRDTIAANGTILVQFDGRVKPVVVKPKNLTTLGATVLPTVKATVNRAFGKNPKDEAVLAYGEARDKRSLWMKATDNAKKTLANYGLINDDERPVGRAVAYESNAVRLVATTAEAGSQITEASLRVALSKAGLGETTILGFIAAATVAKKAATTFTVEIK